MSESTTPEPGHNTLKRKNEDLSNEAEELENNASSHNKRIALDNEQSEKGEMSNETKEVKEVLFDIDEEKYDGLESDEQGDAQDEDANKVEQNKESSSNENDKDNGGQYDDEKGEAGESKPDVNEEFSKDNEEKFVPKKVLQEEVEKFLEEAALLSKLGQPATTPATAPAPGPALALALALDQHPQQHHEESIEATSNPTSSLQDFELDPSYVSFRMYCPVKEASTVVGKGGAKINHLREKAQVKIQTSENLKDVPERIITVKGTAENVAKAFGLIVRTILGEPEDEPANLNSQQYNLKLLIPNVIIGHIIGKQGLKFREIEENSAAKLKAAELPLPHSTDRVLSVLGVADAIHIAVYFIGEVVIEHKDVLKRGKVILYNPANHKHDEGQHGGQSHQHQHQHQHQQQNQLHHLSHHQYQQGFSDFPQTSVPGNQFGSPIGYQKPFGQDGPHQPQPHQPYNFSSMFQPSVAPQQQYGMPQQMAPPPPVSQGVPPQTQYTDEYNNTMIGEVIIKEPVFSGDKYNQDIFVANSLIGSVIGKGGNNIKHIRENSGCTYVRIEPDRGQSIMLGGGRGLTNIRRLTLTGSLESFQKAIYLINQRINTDRQRNSR